MAMVHAACRWAHSPSWLTWPEGWQPVNTLFAFVRLTRSSLTMAFQRWQHHKRCHWYYPVLLSPHGMKRLVITFCMSRRRCKMHWQERAGHLGARFQGEGVVPLPIYWYHSKGNWKKLVRYSPDDSGGRERVYGGKDLWNAWVLSRQWKMQAVNQQRKTTWKVSQR